MSISARVPGKVAAQMLGSAGTCITSLNYLLLRTFEEDAYDLEVPELIAQLEELYQVTPVQEIEDRLHALLNLMLTDAYFEDPLAFIHITMAVATGDPGFELLEQPTVPEMLWAGYEISLNRDHRPLGPKVQALVAGLAQQNGWEAVTGQQEAPAGVDDLMGFLADQEAILGAQLDLLEIPPTARPSLEAWLATHGQALAGVQ